MQFSDSGGKYFRADNTERFQQIYAEIDKLEKTEAIKSKIKSALMYPISVIVVAFVVVAVIGKIGMGIS